MNEGVPLILWAIGMVFLIQILIAGGVIK